MNIFRGDLIAGQTPGSNDSEHLIAQARLVARLFEDFNRHSNICCRDRVFDFAQTRLDGLRLELSDAGFDPHNPERLVQMFMDDPECMSEHATLLDEALWRFKSLVLEIKRHWPEESEKYDRQSEKPEHAWLSEMKLLLFTA